MAVGAIKGNADHQFFENESFLDTYFSLADYEYLSISLPRYAYIE